MKIVLKRRWMILYLSSYAKNEKNPRKISKKPEKRFKSQNAFRSLLQQTFPNQEMHNHKKHFSLFLSIKQKNSPWKPEHWNRSYNSSQTKNQMKKLFPTSVRKQRNLIHKKFFSFFWKIQHRRHKKGSGKATTKQWKRKKIIDIALGKAKTIFRLGINNVVSLLLGIHIERTLQNIFFNGNSIRIGTLLQKFN